MWVTEAAAIELLGIPVDEMTDNPSTLSDQLRELTENTEIVAGALAAGWEIGGDHKSLGTWSRVWHGNRLGVRIALIAGMDSSPDNGLPILADDPSPAALAKRLARFAEALGQSWHVDGGATGSDLMTALRTSSDRERLFTPSEPVPPAERGGTVAELNWARKPTSREASFRYVHGYDRNGSYLAAVGGLHLGIGEPEHFVDESLSEVAFKPSLPGYWKVSIPATSNWMAPHPLVARGPVPDYPVWVTTPELAYAAELGYDPAIEEAYVWPEHSRFLDSWYEKLRDARTALDTDDPDDLIARDMLKRVYSITIGRFAAGKERSEGWAPERRHLIMARAKVNTLRMIWKNADFSGQWPVACSVDTVVYLSDDPDPVTAWPGDPKHLSRGLGMFKWKGSAELAEHRKFLTGNQYKGEDDLTASWPPAATEND